MPLRSRLCITYLLLQSVGVVCWWLLVVFDESIRSRFISLESTTSLWAFAAGDIVLLVLVPIVLCIGIAKRREWTRPLSWLHAGAAAYSTLWAVSMMVQNTSLWLGGVLMVPVAVAALLIAFSLGRD